MMNRTIDAATTASAELAAFTIASAATAGDVAAMEA